jgi:hypothetical protein
MRIDDSFLFRHSPSRENAHIYINICALFSPIRQINNDLFVKHKYFTFYNKHFVLFFCIEAIVELLDLPDEMILAIMNKVKPRVMLLSSIIGIENNRLEQLALDQCHSIDLTFDYYHSPYEMLIKEWISCTLPCIFNYIESLAINLPRMPRLARVVRTIDDKDCMNLKHFKLMGGRLHINTGTPFTTSKLYIILLYLFKHIRQKLILKFEDSENVILIKKEFMFNYSIDT